MSIYFLLESLDAWKFRIDRILTGATVCTWVILSPFVQKVSVVSYQTVFGLVAKIHWKNDGTLSLHKPWESGLKIVGILYILVTMVHASFMFGNFVLYRQYLKLTLKLKLYILDSPQCCVHGFYFLFVSPIQVSHFKVTYCIYWKTSNHAKISSRGK